MKNILITGGSGPLGSAIANYLADNHNVLISTRRKEYQPTNSKVNTINGIDLLNLDDLKRLYNAVEAKIGASFSIINCTGFYETGQKPFLQSTIEDDYKIFNANFRTVHSAAKTLIPLMVNRGGGHFITFSCNSVKHNYPWMIPYTASKNALEALTKGLANEFSKDGIISNSIELATINTEQERAKKPYGDHGNWLKTKEVAKFIHQIIEDNHPYFNGNVVQLFKYSDTYYHESYFDRIKR